MRHALSCAFLLLALPAAAAAQAGRFEITPFGTYRWGGEITTDSTDLFNRDVQVEDSAGYGVSFGIPLNYWAQIELSVDRQDSEFKVDSGLFDPSLKVADVALTYYHAGFLWQWGSGQTVPFFNVSGGVTELDVDLPGVDKEYQPSLGLGGGAKVFFSQNVGLRFEGKAIWTSLDDSNDRHHDYCRRYSCDDNNDLVQGEAKVGLIFAF